MGQQLPVIVVCTEPDFEWKSRLLVRSIREFGGCLRKATIFSYSPRRGKKPSDACLLDFAKHNVDVVLDDLNKDFEVHGFANKVFAMADAELRFPSGRLLFLDSDKILLREPTLLLSLDEKTFAARPVGVANCGVATFEDAKNGKYWKELYKICNVKKLGMF